MPSLRYCYLSLPIPGYLLLLIYSAANLCDRSWGTREQGSGEDEGLWGWRVYITQAWKVVTSTWCCVRCLSRSTKETAEGGGASKMDGREVEALKGEKNGGNGIKGAEFVKVSETADRKEDTTVVKEEGNAESCEYLLNFRHSFM
jgi:hypothetical protein